MAGKKLDRWARHFDHCIACGKSDSKHNAHGICSRCAQFKDRRGSYERTGQTFTETKKQPDWERVKSLESESSGYLGFLEIETYERFCKWQDSNRTNKEVD